MALTTMMIATSASQNLPRIIGFLPAGGQWPPTAGKSIGNRQVPVGARAAAGAGRGHYERNQPLVGGRMSPHHGARRRPRSLRQRSIGPVLVSSWHEAITAVDRKSVV